MAHLGDRFLSSTFYTKFTTVNASGVPTTLGSTPALQFYVGAGATAFTVGLSLDVDFNSITGLNHVTVIATTSATAWATGIDVQVVVTTGTVSGVSIKGYSVCEFSIQNLAAARPTIAGRNLLIDANGKVAVPDTQKVDVDTIKTNPVVNAGTVTFPTTATLASTTNITAGTVTTVSGNVNGSVGSVTGAVGSVTGAVGSVTGNVGGNVVGSVASVTGNVGGNVVGSVASVVGAVGSVTGNVGGNVVGSVASVVAAVAITSNVKKNQALAAFEFLMTDSTTHAPATGLTVTVTRSIDGGAFAAGTLSAVTEISNGIYSIDFGAGDLNGKVVVLQASAAASDTTFERIVTQA